jgi:hypothetical protein
MSGSDSRRLWSDTRVGRRRILLNSSWTIGSSARFRVCESYLNNDDLELFRTTSDNDLVHVWGTSVEGTWRNVERNDIALVYHDGAFVARGQVLRLRHDPDLAEYLWRENVEHGRWSEESPWEYMTFLTDVEEVDVDIEEFNELVGYDETYRPQGFTRVADKRLNQLS